jgi:hypothetical protein
MALSLLNGVIDAGNSPDIATQSLTMIETITVKMNANAKNSRSCFTPNVATSILASVDKIVPLVTDQVAGHASAENIRNALIACMQRRTVCGGNSLNLISNSSSMTLGAANMNFASQFGIFVVKNIGQSVSAGNNECLQFYYGSSVNDLVASSSGTMDTKVFTLELRNQTVNNAGPLPIGQAQSSDSVNTALLNPPAIFRIPIADPALFDQLLKTDDFEPQCTYFKRTPPSYTTGTFETDGCSVVNYTSSVVTCQCSHLTEFAIRVDAREKTTPAGPTGTPSNITTASDSVGMIVGVVIALALFAVGGLIAVRRYKIKQQVEVGRVSPVKDAIAQSQKDLSNEKTRADVKLEGEAEKTVDAVNDEKAVGDEESEDEKVVEPVVQKLMNPMRLPAYQLPPSYEEHLTRKVADVSGSKDNVATRSQPGLS